MSWKTYFDEEGSTNPQNWYKNKAGQWVCIGDEEGENAE
tara:strand:- start:433 stop:549 length:117 start_codon:yes stop_codon:yes gene_type:complete